MIKTLASNVLTHRMPNLSRNVLRNSTEECRAPVNTFTDVLTGYHGNRRRHIWTYGDAWRLRQSGKKTKNCLAVIGGLFDQKPGI